MLGLRKNLDVYIGNSCNLDPLSVSLPVLFEVKVRPTHDEQPRQNMDEDPADPRRHRVRLRRPKVNVQNHHGHAYTENGKPTL